jgi:hypothetical protein
LFFLFLDFETTMPGWPSVFGNQEVPEPIDGFDLNKKPGVEAEKIKELTPLGLLITVIEKFRND